MEAAEGVLELVEIVNNSQIQRRKEYSCSEDSDTSRKPFIVVEGLDGTGWLYFILHIKLIGTKKTNTHKSFFFNF